MAPEDRGPPSEPEDGGVGPIDGSDMLARELDRKELRRLLKENDALWGEDGDSEALWETQHDLLIRLHRAGDVHTVLRRARQAKRVLRGRGSASDLADAVLGLWVMERYDEAEQVIRLAIERLPENRYPWSLLLRHITWDRDPREAMKFIQASLERVPWKAYALVQLGTMGVDLASRELVSGRLAECRDHLSEARGRLEAARNAGGSTEDLDRKADRLMTLVDVLEQRCADAEAAAQAPEEAHDSSQRLLRGIHEAAEAAGVQLEGSPDTELDLDELEKAAFSELPEEDRERTVTVIEVDASPKLGLKRRRREGG
jgi:tetratricopeptide (TPR) repeat protein